MRRLLAVSALTAIGVWACVGSDTAPASPADNRGAAGQRCFDDGTCLPGLTCMAATCTLAEAGSARDAASSTSGQAGDPHDCAPLASAALPGRTDACSSDAQCTTVGLTKCCVRGSVDLTLTDCSGATTIELLSPATACAQSCDSAEIELCDVTDGGAATCGSAKVCARGEVTVQQSGASYRRTLGFCKPK